MSLRNIQSIGRCNRCGENPVLLKKHKGGNWCEACIEADKAKMIANANYNKEKARQREVRKAISGYGR